VASDKIRSFNRDTAWLATGVLSAVFFAALVIAVREHQTNATQAERDFLPSANATTIESVVAKSASSNEKMTPGLGTGIDHALTKTPLQELPFLPSRLKQIVTHLSKTLRKRQYQRPAMERAGPLWRQDLLV
jgi:hypothetical protein